MLITTNNRETPLHASLFSHMTHCTVPRTYRLKGCMSHQQLIRQHSHAPNIHFVGVPHPGICLVVLRVVLYRAVQDLRAEVIDRTQPMKEEHDIPVGESGDGVWMRERGGGVVAP